MVLGVIASDRDHAGQVCGYLDSAGVDYVKVGGQAISNLGDAADRKYRQIEIAELAEGQLSADPLLADLKKDRIDRVVAAGTLKSLLFSLIYTRAQKSINPNSQSLGAQKENALILATRLGDAGIRIEWLADVVPEMACGHGLLNKAPIDALGALPALSVAYTGASHHRVSTAWVGDTQGRGDFHFDADQLLKSVADRSDSTRNRLLILVASHPLHSPLDPPWINSGTINLAKKAGVRSILLDEARGVIVDRQKTLEHASRAGIAIVGVKRA